MRRNSFRSSVLPWILLVVVGCKQGGGTAGPPPQTGLPTVQMTLGSRAFTLEVADTDKSRETGLMYRDSMTQDHGMIFVFGDEEVREFYMANTRIPLDIAFLDAGGKVVSIKTMQPLDLRTTSSDNPAKYAIEMDAGVASEIGLKVGQKAVIAPRAMNPAGEKPPG